MTGTLPEPTPPSTNPPPVSGLPPDAVGLRPVVPATYAESGVDIDAGERAVDLIAPLVASTRRTEVLGGLGGFGGLFALDNANYRQPVLVAGTDGVGTKAVVAEATGRFDTIGIDLVAMCVDDLVCQGAEPLFVLDYIATGAVDPDQMTELVAGVAAGCRQVGATLLGGEMAEHPGVMKPGQFDLVGFAVGVVERSMMLGPSRVQPGDTLIGLGSAGLRCNGYTLARRVLLERAGLTLDGPAWAGAAGSLADELLRPSVIYTPAVRAAMAAIGVGDRSGVHAAAHITGGGFGGNVPRSLPDGMRAVIDRSAWEVPRIFSEIRRLGHVADDEMARVFNLGLGMIVMVAADGSKGALEALQDAGVDAAVVGRVDAGERGVEFVGAPFWPAATDGADGMEPR